jgi:hypothetical protein
MVLCAGKQHWYLPNQLLGGVILIKIIFAVQFIPYRQNITINPKTSATCSNTVSKLWYSTAVQVLLTVKKAHCYW